MAMKRRPSTVHVGSQPRNLSFSGCGFLGVYHIGVACCFKEHAPRFLSSVDHIYGCSAGCLIAGMLINGISIEDACRVTLDIAYNARSRYLGPLSPGFKINQILFDQLDSILPNDAHVRSSGKLHISLTRVSDMQNVIVSQFSTRQELISTLLSSCFVPLYSGINPPKYRGVSYIDGGLSNNLPTHNDTITISPWSGGSDICPKDSCHTSLVEANLANQSMQFTLKNIHRFCIMFFPPEAEKLIDFCKQGYKEALGYLHCHGMFEGGRHPRQRSLSFSCPLSRIPSGSQVSLMPPMLSRRRFSSAPLIKPEIILEELETESEEDSSDVQFTISDDDESECKDEEEHTTAFDTVYFDHLSSLYEHTLNNNNESFSKSSSITTIVHLSPNDILEEAIFQISLPPEVIEALEETYLKHSEGWLKPVKKIVSYCGKTLMHRLPLEKSFELACALLNHVTKVPEKFAWLFDYIRAVTLFFYSYFKSTGKNILCGTMNVSVEVAKQLEVVSHQLSVVVQVLIQEVVQIKYSSLLCKIVSSSSNLLGVQRLTRVLGI